MCRKPPIKARRNETGFTLIEIMVVVTLIVVLTGFAIPGFRRSILHEDSRKALDGFSNRLESYRIVPGTDSSPAELVFDSGYREMWRLVDGSQSKEKEAVPEALRIAGVYGPGRLQPELGKIGFHNGYTDPAYIQLEANGKEWTLVLHPYLRRVERIEGWIIPEGWDEP